MNSSGSSWLSHPKARVVPNLWSLSHQNPQVLFHHMIVSLTYKVRRVSVAHTCGYLDTEIVQYPLVPPSITPEVHILIGGMFARRAPGALLLDYVLPEEPPSTPLGNALRIR